MPVFPAWRPCRTAALRDRRGAAAPSWHPSPADSPTKRRQLRHQLLRSREPVAVPNEPGDLGPVRATHVQAKAGPSARTNVGREKVPFRVQRNPVPVLAGARLPTKRHHTIAVMVDEKVGERLAPDSKRSMLTAQLARDFREGGTEGREAGQALVFTRG